MQLIQRLNLQSNQIKYTVYPVVVRVKNRDIYRRVIQSCGIHWNDLLQWSFHSQSRVLIWWQKSVVIQCEEYKCEMNWCNGNLQQFLFRMGSLRPNLMERLFAIANRCNQLIHLTTLIHNNYSTFEILWITFQPTMQSIEILVPNDHVFRVGIYHL